MRSLAHFAPVFDRVLDAAALRIVAEGREVLERVLCEDRRFVFALNHGPGHLPVLPVAALGRLLLEAGADDLRAVGILFRPLYHVPGLRRAVRYLTQVDQAPSFAELVDGFERDSWDAVVLMPEGAGCMFGSPAQLQPFASPRFVEVAARIGAPIVLVVHTGLEGHARELPLPRWARESPWLTRAPYGLGRALERSGSIVLPALSFRPTVIRLSVEVHRPSIDAAALEAMSPAERRAWVEREAAVVHAKMAKLQRLQLRSRVASTAAPQDAPIP